MSQVVDTVTGEVLANEAASAVELHKTALVLPEDWSFSDWSEYGHTLSRMAEGVMWWIGDWWRYGESRYGERAAQALDSESYSFDTFMHAGWVAKKFEPCRRLQALSWSHHHEVASLEPTAADQLLNDAVTNGWSTRDLRSAAKVHKLRAKRAAVAAIEDSPAESPASLGPFPILYADPPWRYDYAEDSGRAIENHYPTMTLDEIKALVIPAADDAVLFLWATSPKLTEALEVVEAWGFEYRTCAVWAKDRIGMGYYFRQQHELLLVGKRGDIPAPAPDTRPSSLIYGSRLAHSAKPENTYELIESMYPHFERSDEGSEFCELFCRGEPRKGWRGWGNQAVTS